jgi:hypothetical protein
MSQMQLHLDEDSEERRTREAIRGGKAFAAERSNVSVTSINFLTSDSKRDGESHLNEDYSEADEDVESNDEYIETSKKKTSRVQKICTGDHQGSFHEGLFHYMRDGQGYLSTNCEHCYETRKNLQYIDEINGIDVQRANERDLDTIMENEPYDNSYDSDTASYEEILIRANSKKGLGQQHLGMNVHKCSSSTCTRCAKNQQPLFLSRNTDSSGQSLFTDIYKSSVRRMCQSFTIGVLS